MACVFEGSGQMPLVLKICPKWQSSNPLEFQSLTPENMLEPEQVKMVLLHICISQKVS